MEQQTQPLTGTKPPRHLAGASWRLRVIQLLAGCVLYSAAVSMIIAANNLFSGGLSGLALVINLLSGFPVGTTIFLLNVPLLIWGWFKLGRETMLITLGVLLVSAVMIDLMEGLPAIQVQPILASIYGAMALAAGMALIFRAGGTSGGFDIVVRILRLRFPYIKSGQLFMFFDLLVIALVAVVSRDIEKALYTGINIIVFSFVFDHLLYGGDSAKVIYIVSDHHERIVARLLRETQVGITYLQGRGAYSGKEKRIILCAMKNHLLPKAQQVILEEDPQAFLIIGMATEVFGEGFKDYGQPLL